MTRGLVRNEPLAQRERAVEYPSDSDYCALFQGAKEPRSQGAKEPRSRKSGALLFFAVPQLDSQPLTSCLPSPGSLASWLLSG